jgi:hypothetical protein
VTVGRGPYNENLYYARRQTCKKKLKHNFIGLQNAICRAADVWKVGDYAEMWTIANHEQCPSLDQYEDAYPVGNFEYQYMEYMEPFLYGALMNYLGLNSKWNQQAVIS